MRYLEKHCKVESKYESISLMDEERKKRLAFKNTGH